ncbi:pre-piRNA 3'-exonuclease trimmer-like isoform X2 [Schistocerca piceifrons]|uniref:pre-piRNA 3'-exonuclease trimmer-like isoform X2 n=1 Tax=Schistocerca piceifrons TaxID=274613 RepID=UPI001F5FD879|nr:pre-piRNA 3'-exonuclease trimmer-like isoform X2 [Schistocerca piceifrons]XP_049938282.1 pre-piRNA 3'-exonuclease trimmer-like isoform X1 [Schistocerca serialis cubense]
MVDILRSNFEEKLPEIKAALTNAKFIAIDTEFTGLSVYKNYKPSLFDTGRQRYEKLRRNLEKVIIIQIGLSVFSYVRDENKYVANIYRIPVYPCSFGSIDSVYLTQASSVHFLCEYDFDFNKVMYEGVPYLNLRDEKRLKQELQECRNVIDLRNLSFLEEEAIIYLKTEMDKVVDWVSTACIGDTLLLSTFLKARMKRQLGYCLHIELRHRFNNIWTYGDEEGIIVKKIATEKHRLMSNKENKEKLDEDFIHYLLGFSHIFKLLVELKKPIVGHNCLLDLMLLYQQFHDVLPGSYSSFKKKMNELFPNLYDTKHISFELQHRLDRDVLPSTILSDLYAFFEEGRGSVLGAYTPTVETEFGDDGVTKQIHDAAWDSYVSGYCFIRMAHVIANRKFEIIVQQPLTSVEHFTSLEDFKNKINVIRCAVSHICLSGPDPESRRPQWIYVETRTNRKLSEDEVYLLFSQYDAVDVTLYSKNSALVAIGNSRSARMIRKKLQENEEFKVTSYSLISHNKLLRCVLWICAASTSMTAAWFITRHAILRNR